MTKAQSRIGLLVEVQVLTLLQVSRFWLGMLQSLSRRVRIDRPARGRYIRV